MTALAWEELELYGNRELLTRAYVARYGGRLNEKKARQISANIAQSRQYFNAATEVGLIARPLLVYYGVLSIARAIILYRDKTASEESIHGSHGLSTNGWSATLAGSLANIRSLRLEVTNGTFSELLDATGNVDRFAARPHDFMAKPGVMPSLSPRLPAGFQFTNGDLLSRIPELSDLHERVFGQASESYRCYVTGAAGDIPHELIKFALVNVGANHTMAEFANVLGISEHGELRGSLEVLQDSGKEMWQASIKLGDGLGEPKTIPPNFTGLNNTLERRYDVFFNWPMQSQFYPSTLARMFMLSYSLGMLARYFPSVWMSGISNENDTACFPLLTRSVAFLQSNFPAVALAEFTAP